MAASAQVIDLGEVRRRRAASAATGRTISASMPQPVPVAWIPVWFFMPFWVAGQAGGYAAPSQTMA